MPEWWPHDPHRSLPLPSRLDWGQVPGRELVARGPMGRPRRSWGPSGVALVMPGVGPTPAVWAVGRRAGLWPGLPGLQSLSGGAAGGLSPSTPFPHSLSRGTFGARCEERCTYPVGGRPATPCGACLCPGVERARGVER